MPDQSVQPHTIDLDRWGARLNPDGTTRFRIWAPSVEKLSLQFQAEDPVPMHRHAGGWYELTVPAPSGTRYKFTLPNGLSVPDPASRLQYGDVHGWSVVTAPDQYPWKMQSWRGRPWNEAVIYEAHAGLLGGFVGMLRHLDDIQEVGITVIEFMPINAFPGEHNWGYDGTLNFAPDTSYGTPDDLKRLIDEAHRRGLCVMLDVVYNHFGPDGSYISNFCAPFFTEDMHTPWGAAIDFRRLEVFDFYVANALYWLREFRFDGLRFDALHAVQPQDALPALADAIRAGVDPERHISLVMEHEDNAAHLLRPSPTEPGFDAQWADDFHHCLHVLLTGETGSYYIDYERSPTEMLARVLAEGFAYQGEQSRLRGRPRGEPSDYLPPSSFVVHLQNHDQIGNRARGERMAALAPHDKLRAATALLLLSPMIPLMFMGDEWASSTPFLFFTDHHEELAELVRKGRAKEFGIKVSPNPDEPNAIPDPNARATYDMCRVEKADPTMRALYQDLLELRAQHVVPGIMGAHALGCDVLAEGAIWARWRLGNGAELTILLNLGEPAPAPMPPGTVLHASGPDVVAALQAGMLPAASALVVITAPT